MFQPELYLTALKTDLGIVTTAYDQRLLAYLGTAARAIEREGITLTDCIDDGTLVVQYAAWLWRDRDNGQGMPRMIRWALNNRLFSEKMSDGT